MAFYVLCGQYMNHLSRALTVPTMSPIADTSYPVAGLYDNRANFPAKFSSSTSDATVSVDINALANPDFETALMTSWTSYSGAVMTASSSIASGGSYSARSSGESVHYQDFSAISGEQRKISAALYGTGVVGGGESIVRIYCLETGHYLQVGGASWSTGVADLLYWPDESWSTQSQAYTVEPVSTTLKDTVTLRVYIAQSTGAGTTYRDNVIDVPAVTWGSVHGHNLMPTITPTFDSSTDGSAYTTRISPTLRRDAFYGVCAAQYVRYWRLKLAGTPTTTLWLGEVVLGQYQSLTVNPLYPGTLEASERESRLLAVDGSQWVYTRGAGPQRRLGLNFAFNTDAEYNQWKDIILRQARGGKNVAIIAPVEMDSSVVMLGRLEAGMAWNKENYNLRTAAMEFIEEPLANMG